MLSLEEIINSIRRTNAVLTDEDLRSLPVKKALIYGRVSTSSQVKNSRESIRDVAKLLKLAIQDGYQTDLDPAAIERWLEAIQNGEDDSRVKESGSVIIDCQDLGLSGSLGEDKRPGLKNLWEKVENGEVGAVYLNEGMSRLSRDKNKILGYQLLKLLKDHQCRIRLLEGIFSPAIGRDWQNLAEDLDDSADEMKKLGIRLGRRRDAKAAQGRHIGSPVCPGYIVEIEGLKNDGSYILGKWQPYAPHQEIVTQVLTELVRQRSIYKAAQALFSHGVTFPYFPPELAYMETRSVLRQYHRNDRGYVPSAEAIQSLAKNLALVGIFKWKDILLPNNHTPIVTPELFLAAYEIASQTKPKGKAVYAEPMEWFGLLYCYNQDPPARLSAHNGRRRWACHLEHQQGLGERCLYIEDHLLTPPLTRAFLDYLDLEAHAWAVLEKLKSEVSCQDLEASRRKYEESRIRTRIANLENCLGSGNPKTEKRYLRQIEAEEANLQALLEKPAAPKTTLIDLERVTQFLKNLESNWEKYSSRLRNRLLRLLVERVELRHDIYQIEAVIVWKVGFRQVIRITRPTARYTKEKRWSAKDDQLLKMLWPSASWEALRAALPERSSDAITQRASRLKITRPREKKYPTGVHNLWTKEDDRLLTEMYNSGESVINIAEKLGRSVAAVGARASIIGLSRPSWYRSQMQKQKPTWEIQNIKVMQDSTCLHYL